jgi:hypothetical protein
MKPAAPEADPEDDAERDLVFIKQTSSVEPYERPRPGVNAESAPRQVRATEQLGTFGGGRHAKLVLSRWGWMRPSAVSIFFDTPDPDLVTSMTDVDGSCARSRWLWST